MQQDTRQHGGRSQPEKCRMRAIVAREEILSQKMGAFCSMMRLENVVEIRISGKARRG
jgi:hypothetical protein